MHVAVPHTLAVQKIILAIANQGVAAMQSMASLLLVQLACAAVATRSGTNADYPGNSLATLSI